MGTKIKKIMLSVFTIMIALVLGAMVSLRENRKTDAALNYCRSGGTVYIQDDGGCDLGDWNAMSISVSSKTGYGPYVHFTNLGSLPGAMKNVLSDFNSSYNASTYVYVMYVGTGGTITYKEKSNCDGKKQIRVGDYGASGISFGWSILRDDGDTYSVSTGDVLPVQFYGTKSCALFDGGEQVSLTDRAMLVVGDPYSAKAYFQNLKMGSSTNAPLKSSSYNAYKTTSFSIDVSNRYSNDPEDDDYPISKVTIYSQTCEGYSCSDYQQLWTQSYSTFGTFTFSKNVTATIPSGKAIGFKVTICYWSSNGASNAPCHSESDNYVPIYADTTGPTITTSGESTTWTNADRVISVTAVDALVNISAYSCNNSSWTSSTAESFSCTYSSNTTTATIGVKDALGNQTTKTVNVYVDKTAPTWSVSGGGKWDGTTLYVKPSASLTFSLTDSLSGVYGYSSAASYYKYGWSTSTSTYPSTYSTTFTSMTSSKVAFNTTAPSTAGTHYVCIYYVGRDSAGNLPSKGVIYNSFSSYSAYAWFKVVVDNIAPSLDISTDDGYFDGYTFYVKSGTNVYISFADNYYLKNYDSSAYYRYLWCDNTNHEDYDCYGDSVQPYYVAVDDYRSKTGVDGTIQIPELASGTYYYLWIEGDVGDAAGWMMENSTNIYSEDKYSYNARVFEFYIDNDNPTASVTCTTTWKTSYVVDNTSSYIYATFGDSHSGVYSAYMYIKKAGTSSYTTYSYSYGTYVYATSSYLASGINYIYFGIYDYAFNYHSTSAQTLYLDETHPTVTPSCTGSWCDGSTYVAANTSNYVKATISDSHSGLNVTRVYVKKAGATDYTYYSYTSGTSIYSNSSYFASGVNYVYFYATDKVGNSTTSTTYTLYVDKTNPSVTPSCTGTWCNGTSYVAANTSSYISAAISDAHSGLNTTRVYVKKAGASSYTYYSYTSGTTIYANSSYFANGANYLYFYATDNVGNSTTSTTYTLYVDGENPLVTTVTTFISEYVDLENSRVYIPFTPKDNHSGVASVTATNSGSYSSNKLWFPMTSISNKTLSYTYTIKDNVGNTKSASVTFDVSLTYDEVLQNKVKTGMTNKLDTGKTLTSQNSNKQLKYVMDSDACTILANLSIFGINPNTSTVNSKYIFVSQNLSADLSVYNSLAKPTTLSTLQSGIISPLGQKGSVYLVLLFEDMGIHVASGSIGAAAATTLSTDFDTYENVETNYVGAGLGDDGTVVSFSNDATSSMAVTLGASNVIEKRDVYGVLEWEKAITSSGKIELKKVINNEYGILVLGETTSGSINGTSYPLMGGKDILVIRLNKDGDILFTNVIGTSSDDLVIAGDMNDNRIAIISSVNDSQASLITMNVDGTGLNINTISSTGLELTGVAINANKVAVIGTSKSSTVARNQDMEDIGNVGGKDAFVQLYTDNALTWVRRLGGVGDDTFYAVSLDNNNIYIVGQAGSAMLHDNLGSTKLLDAYGAKDGMIVKYDYDGNMIQLSSIGGMGDDTFNQILVTSTNVIVAGLSSSSTITASHYHNNTFNINRLSDMDTVIITMSKDLIIEEGLNLSGDEANLVQEIGINQYTEQLMILSSSGVHTQKVVANKLKFDVVYENGTLKVKANEEIAYATLFNGNEYIDINNGIKVAPGAYEVTVTSTSGVSLTKVVNVNIPVIGTVEEHSILPMISMFISITTLGILSVLVLRKYKKEIKVD